MESSPESCTRCEHPRDVHHSFGCDGNLEAERAFWAEFESSPGFLQTREAIEALEKTQPKPCRCSVHHYEWDAPSANA
jgi:hypothetical protein